MVSVHRNSICSDLSGNRYLVEISIEDSDDKSKYPEGVKAVFRLIRLDVDSNGETELVLLIDNHAPQGFHSHDKLPDNHDFRNPLYINHWKEAWGIFQTKCREVLQT